MLISRRRFTLMLHEVAADLYPGDIVNPLRQDIRNGSNKSQDYAFHQFKRLKTSRPFTELPSGWPLILHSRASRSRRATVGPNPSCVPVPVRCRAQQDRSDGARAISSPKLNSPPWICRYPQTSEEALRNALPE